MPFIGKNPTAGFATIVKDDFTADGSTTVFTLSKIAATANDIAVFVGNVRQEPTDAYTVSGTTLTMSAAPATGVNFYVLHIAGTIESSVVPPDGSIGTAKIVDDAVSTAKIADNAVTSAKISDTLTIPTQLITPSVAGSGDTDTSISFPGSNIVQVNNGATARYKFHSLNGTSLFEVQASSTGGAGAGGAFLKFKGSNGTPVDIASIDGSMTNGSVGSESGILSFFTMNSGTNSEKARLFSDGSMAVPNGISLGNGISANASNLLDDYEEGSWTPYISGSSTTGTGTYSTQIGRYVKIGKQVSCWGRLDSSSTPTGTGTLQVSGFPFTKESSFLAWGTETSIAYFFGFSSYGTATDIVRLLGPLSNNTFARFHSFNNRGDTSAPPTPANFVSGASMYFAATYEVQ
jgi:hypothetical protein